MNLVYIHLRKQVQDCHAGDDQDKPHDGAQVGRLLEKEDSADGYKRDAECRPGGIRDADGDGAQAEAQQVERRHIADERGDGRNELGELLRHLEERGAGRFCDNGEDKEYVVEHRENIRKNVIGSFWAIELGLEDSSILDKGVNLL